MRTLTVAIALASLAVSHPARASSLDLIVDHGFGGADNGAGKPIDHTTFEGDFAADAGPLAVGVSLAATQNGRAGIASDWIGGQVGRPLRLGPATFTPSAQLGYARAPNYDFAYAGLAGRLTWPLGPRLTAELEARARHSFLVNAAPLNHDALPHTAWTEARATAALLLRVGPHVEIGVRAGLDRGSNPDAIAGVFTRLGF